MNGITLAPVAAVMVRAALVSFLSEMRRDLRRNRIPARDRALHRQAMAEVESLLAAFDAAGVALLSEAAQWSAPSGPVN